MVGLVKYVWKIILLFAVWFLVAAILFAPNVQKLSETALFVTRKLIVMPFVKFMTDEIKLCYIWSFA